MTQTAGDCYGRPSDLEDPVQLPWPWSPLLLALLLAACSKGASEDGVFTASIGDESTASETGTGSTGESDGSGDASESDSESSGSDGSSDSDEVDTDATSEADATESDTTETGDPDPCPLICEGQNDGTPTSCAAPNFIGRSEATAEFFFGGNTTGSMDSDNDVCNGDTDSGHDHFFRIYLYTDDQIDVTMTGQFDKRVKVHNEAECIGDASECTDGVLSYTALAEGWYTIVADGQSAAFMDWGDYTLTVLLTLGGADACNCL